MRTAVSRMSFALANCTQQIAKLCARVAHPLVFFSLLPPSKQYAVTVQMRSRCVLHTVWPHKRLFRAISSFDTFLHTLISRSSRCFRVSCAVNAEPSNVSLKKKNLLTWNIMQRTFHRLGTIIIYESNWVSKIMTWILDIRILYSTMAHSKFQRISTVWSDFVIWKHEKKLLCASHH